MTFVPLISSAPLSPILTSTPEIGLPTLAGRLSCRLLAQATGLVSVRPYPWITGSPSPINTREILGDSAAPPANAVLNLPPSRAIILLATSALSKGHNRKPGVQPPRPCACSKRAQPTSTASWNSFLRNGGPASSLALIAA